MAALKAAKAVLITSSSVIWSERYHFLPLQAPGVPVLTQGALYCTCMKILPLALGRGSLATRKLKVRLPTHDILMRSRRSCMSFVGVSMLEPVVKEWVGRPQDLPNHLSVNNDDTMSVVGPPDPILLHEHTELDGISGVGPVGQYLVFESSLYFLDEGIAIMHTMPPEKYVIPNAIAEVLMVCQVNHFLCPLKRCPFHIVPRLLSSPFLPAPATGRQPGSVGPP